MGGSGGKRGGEAEETMLNTPEAEAKMPNSGIGT